MRDAALEARLAAYRRRRLARLAAVVAALGAIVALALFVNDEEEPGREESAAGSGPSPGAVACGGETPPPADPRQYDGPPEEVIERGVDYGAVIETSCGDIEIDLLEERAPETVNNFVFLARAGFYDGLIWHRVEQNFVIQTGDPNGLNGTEPDGPGYTIPDELPERDREYVYGVVAMANTGRPDSGGSQFFIIVHDYEGALAEEPEPAGLDAVYSIFGTVAGESYETLQEIAVVPTKGGGDPVEAVTPLTPVYIEKIRILER